MSSANRTVSNGTAETDPATEISMQDFYGIVETLIKAAGGAGAEKAFTNELWYYKDKFWDYVIKKRITVPPESVSGEGFDHLQPLLIAAINAGSQWQNFAGGVDHATSALGAIYNFVVRKTILQNVVDRLLGVASATFISLVIVDLAWHVASSAATRLLWNDSALYQAMGFRKEEATTLIKHMKKGHASVLFMKVAKEAAAQRHVYETSKIFCRRAHLIVATELETKLAGFSELSTVAANVAARLKSWEKKKRHHYGKKK